MTKHPKTPPGLRVVVQNVSTARGVPGARKLSGWIKRSLQGEVSGGELSIRIVDEAEGAALNRRYRGKSGATNVLSFAGTEDLGGLGDARVLGDLVVCAPIVAREAEAQAKALDAHWAHIVLHGVLHLLGYDHESDADAEVMECRERELLAGLGFEDPYAAER